MCLFCEVDPELVPFNWVRTLHSSNLSQNILDKATIWSDDRKKWEIHRGKVEEQCKPRGSKLIAATQYKKCSLKVIWNSQSTSKVQANHWCMRMARRREGHGSQGRYSPRSKESKSLSKVFGRRPGLANRRTSDRNCNSLVQQGLSKINYADSQYGNCSSRTAIQQGSTQIHKVFSLKYLAVRRSKHCLEFSFAWGRLKISKWMFHSCTIFEAFLINSLRFSEV